ncbi:hypothetical protein BJ170DRAFT_617514 [Xylariales sp. AK1849]|nr:hypothetical protein BJ170DRAFT_617514 [Xylariales sp. AK1849]
MRANALNIYIDKQTHQQHRRLTNPKALIIMPKPISIPRKSRANSNTLVLWDDTDPYGGLGTLSRNEEIVVSPISHWDLTQKRAWPPSPYQAYCVKHFLQECLVYYSLEKEKLKREESRLIPADLKPNDSGKVAVKPARVQPSRGAKKVTEEKKTTLKKEPKEIREARSTLQGLSESLNLHLPWPSFTTRLEAQIAQVRSTIYAYREKTKTSTKTRKRRRSSEQVLAGEDVSFGHPSCPFEKGIRLDCRYCQYRPTDLDQRDEPPIRSAPVAPMHLIEMDNIAGEQVAQLGGLRFAVDVCGKEEKIVLLKMKTLNDLKKVHDNIHETSLGEKAQAPGDSSGSMSSKTTEKSRSRISRRDADEINGPGPKKKRKAI